MAIEKTLAERYQAIQTRIRQTAERIGRDPAEITLVGVSKTWPTEKLRAAYAAGLRHFGENRAHELTEKAAELATDCPDIIWHFIGHLQTRQSQPIADHGHLFHGADRPKIIGRLGRQLNENGRQLQTLLEVNVSGEASKGGFPAHNWQEDNVQQQALKQAVQLTTEQNGLKLQGLMTMAPWGAPAEEIRQIFSQTRQLRDWLAAETDIDLPILSMGMTDDFEIAIEEGATHVRVGRAIFGDRQYN